MINARKWVAILSAAGAIIPYWIPVWSSRLISHAGVKLITLLNTLAPLLIIRELTRQDIGCRIIKLCDNNSAGEGKDKLELSRMPTFWIYPTKTALKSTKKQDLCQGIQSHERSWHKVYIYQNLWNSIKNKFSYCLETTDRLMRNA